MQSRNKTLVINIIFFTLVTFISKGISYFVLPIFTNYMSTADYGVADLLMSTVNLLYPLTALGMSSAVLRFSKGETQETKIVFTEAFQITLFMGAISLLAVPFINIFTDLSYYVWFVPAEMAIINLVAIIVNLCNSVGKTRLFVWQSLVKGVTLSGCAILFLKYYDMGVNGFVLSYLAADIASISVLVFTAKISGYMTWNIDRGIKRSYREKLLRYGVPLVPNSMAAWVIQMSDRYMVAYWYGWSATGVYAVSYKIPSVIKLFSGVFNQAWQISVIKESEKGETKEYFNKIRQMYNTVCFLAACLIMLTIKALAEILFGQEFYSAWKYVPLLVFSMVLSLMGEYLGSYYYPKNRTGMLFSSTLIGTVVNIVLNICFIPQFSAWGATIATVISNGAVFIHRAWDMQRDKKYITISKKDVIGLILLLNICIIYYIAERYGEIISAITLLLLMVLFWDEVKQIIGLFKKILKKISGR